MVPKGQGRQAWRQHCLQAMARNHSGIPGWDATLGKDPTGKVADRKIGPFAGEGLVCYHQRLCVHDLRIIFTACENLSPLTDFCENSSRRDICLGGGGDDTWVSSGDVIAGLHPRTETRKWE